MSFGINSQPSKRRFYAARRDVVFTWCTILRIERRIGRYAVRSTWALEDFFLFSGWTTCFKTFEKQRRLHSGSVSAACWSPWHQMMLLDCKVCFWEDPVLPSLILGSISWFNIGLPFIILYSVTSANILFCRLWTLMFRVCHKSSISNNTTCCSVLSLNLLATIARGQSS